MWLLAIWISYSVKYVFKSFAIFPSELSFKIILLFVIDLLEAFFLNST